MLPQPHGWLCAVCYLSLIVGFVLCARLASAPWLALCYASHTVGFGCVLPSLIVGFMLCATPAPWLALCCVLPQPHSWLCALPVLWSALAACYPSLIVGFMLCATLAPASDMKFLFVNTCPILTGGLLLCIKLVQSRTVI